MAKAIETLGSLTVGHVGLGLHGDKAGSPAQQVHDGDTINVRTLGNFGVRFLGMDTPEISFTLPGSQQFLPLDNAKWETFLTNPFDPQYQLPALSEGLKEYLNGRVGVGVAKNHHRHAMAAQRALEAEVAADIEALGATQDTFEFFMAFASEIMDQYGRLLGYINRQQKQKPRPLDYNVRMLNAGLANAYFIWPNINPFRKQKSLVDAVPPPGTANTLAQQEATLRQARQWLKDARQQRLGLFDNADPLRLEAFEVRYLAGRRKPNRWVVDLSKNEKILHLPESYYLIPHAEDRLFVPQEFVPLFVEKGWQKQQ